MTCPNQRSSRKKVSGSTPLNQGSSPENLSFNSLFPPLHLHPLTFLLLNLFPAVMPLLGLSTTVHHSSTIFLLLLLLLLTLQSVTMVTAQAAARRRLRTRRQRAVTTVFVPLPLAELSLEFLPLFLRSVVLRPGSLKCGRSVLWICESKWRESNLLQLQIK